MRPAICVALLVATACGGSQKAPATPSSPVLVRDAGQAPRQRLRYMPTLHARERAELEFRVSVDTKFTNTVLEEGQRHAALPAIRAIGQFEVTAVDPDGNATITFSVEDAYALDDVTDPRLQRVVDAELAGLRRLRSTSQVSPTGVVLAARVEQASRPRRERLAGLYDAVREASGVFPDEPVGVGAIWEVKTRPTIGGIAWGRTATYLLREVGDTTVSIDVSVEMRAESQALRVEPNRSTRLTSATASSTTTLKVPLRGLVSTGQTLERSEASYSIINRRLRITSTIRTDSTFSIKPVDVMPPAAPVSEPSLATVAPTP